MKRAVFIDRDGTIIEDTHYIRNPDKVRLLPGAIEGLRRMSEKGYLLFVVSNQSGVGRGIISENEFLRVHERFCEYLQAESIPIARFLYCFHHPDDPCQCRKPRPGLLPRYHQDEPIDWGSSYTVGDKQSDLELADAIGGKGYLVLSGEGPVTREALERGGKQTGYRVCADLAQVAEELPPLLT